MKNNIKFKRLTKSGKHSRHIVLPKDFLTKLSISDDSILSLEVDNDKIVIKKVLLSEERSN